MRVIKRTLGQPDDVRVAAGLELDEAIGMSARLNSQDPNPHAFYLVANEEYDLSSETTRTMLEVVLGAARVTERASA